MEVPKTKNRATIRSYNPTLGHALESKKTHPPLFQYCLQQPRHGRNLCSTTEDWIKKMWYIYTIEHHSAIKNNEIMTSGALVNGPRDCHTE